MNEKEPVTDLLHDLRDDGDRPLWTSPDDLLVQGERAVRRRRVAQVGVVTAALAVIALGIPAVASVLPGRGTGGTLPAAGQSSAQKQVAPPGPTALPSAHPDPSSIVEEPRDPMADRATVRAALDLLEKRLYEPGTFTARAPYDDTLVSVVPDYERGSIKLTQYAATPLFDDLSKLVDDLLRDAGHYQRGVRVYSSSIGLERAEWEKEHAKLVARTRALQEKGVPVVFEGGFDPVTIATGRDVGEIRGEYSPLRTELQLIYREGIG